MLSILTDPELIAMLVGMTEQEKLAMAFQFADWAAQIWNEYGHVILNELPLSSPTVPTL
jgi:hypothetical protein